MQSGVTSTDGNALKPKPARGPWDRKSSGVAQKAWQRKMQHEQQMKQLASDILRVRSETEQL